MSENLRALTEATYRAVMDALHRLGALPPRADAFQRGNNSWDDLGEWVQVTSLTPSGGYYPAAVLSYDTVAQTWSTGASVWFTPANGETPVLNGRYHARNVGANASNVAVYSACLGNGSSGGNAGITVEGVNPGTGDSTATYADITTLAFDEASGFAGSNVGSTATISLQSASATHSGVVDLVAQSFAGAKTFTATPIAIYATGAVDCSSYVEADGGVFFGGSYSSGYMHLATSQPYSASNALVIMYADPAVPSAVAQNTDCTIVNALNGGDYGLMLKLGTGISTAAISGGYGISYNGTTSWGKTGTGGGGDTFTGGICTALGSGGGGSGLTIGSTTITGGTSGDLLYDNGGVLGQLGLPDSVIVSGGGNLILSGDVASPGNSYYYGTNSGGTKGWYTLPSGSGGDMLANLANSPNALTNPAGTTLTANTWNDITATSACSGTLPTATAGHVIGIRIVSSSTNLFTLGTSGGLIYPGQPSSAGVDSGISSRVMHHGETAILRADGTNWIKVAGITIPMICQMCLGSAQVAANGGAGTTVNLDTVLDDTTGLMADTTNHRIAIKRPGRYKVLGTVACNTLSANAPRWQVGISTASPIANGECSGLAGGFPAPLAGAEAILASGTNVTLAVFQNSGAGQNIENSTTVPFTFLLVEELAGQW